MFCSKRTTDAEKECYYSNQVVDPNMQTCGISPKDLWISETAVRIMREIPYAYVIPFGNTMIAKHIYAATVAKEMADAIFK